MPSAITINGNLISVEQGEKSDMESSESSEEEDEVMSELEADDWLLSPSVFSWFSFCVDFRFSRSVDGCPQSQLCC